MGYVQQNLGAIGNWVFPFKGLTGSLVCPRTQCQRSNLQSAWAVCEADPFANSGSAGGAGGSWDSLQRWRHWQTPFLHSHSTLLAQGVCVDMTPSCCLAKAFGGKKVQHYPAVSLKPACTGSCSTLLLPDCSRQAWAVMTLCSSFAKAKGTDRQSTLLLHCWTQRPCPALFAFQLPC